MPLNAEVLATTPGAGLDALKEAMAQSLTQTPPEELGTFKAVIISELVPVTYEQIYATAPPGKARAVVAYYFWGRLLDGNTGHLLLPDNCDPAYAANDQDNFEVTMWHTRFLVEAELGTNNQSGVQLSYGDFVEVGLRSTEHGYDTSMGTYIKKISDGFGASQNKETCVRMGQNAFVDGDMSLMSQTQELRELGENLPDTGEEIIDGSGVSAVSGRVNIEWAFWKDLPYPAEEATGASSRLQTYWTNIGLGSDAYVEWWTKPSEHHWSAVFISYLLRGKSFATKETGYSHLAYSQAVAAGKQSGWKAYDLGSSKIRLSVGDVLVQGREGGTHGDIVWKIDESKAYLAGGNVGQTMTISRSVSVDNTRLVTSPGSYLVVLKKGSFKVTE